MACCWRSDSPVSCGARSRVWTWVSSWGANRSDRDTDADCVWSPFCVAQALRLRLAIRIVTLEKALRIMVIRLLIHHIAKGADKGLALGRTALGPGSGPRALNPVHAS